MNQLRTSVTLAVQRRSSSAVPSRPRKRSMMRFTCRNFASEYSRVVGARQRAFGAGAQIAAGSRGSPASAVGLRLQLRCSGRGCSRCCVSDRLMRVDALADRLPLAVELRLEVGHLADGVLVQQLLEARLEARQVVGLAARPASCGTRPAASTLASTSCVSSWIGVRYAAIALTIFSPQARELLVLGVDAAPAATRACRCSRLSQDFHRQLRARPAPRRAWLRSREMTSRACLERAPLSTCRACSRKVLRLILLRRRPRLRRLRVALQLAGCRRQRGFQRGELAAASVRSMSDPSSSCAALRPAALDLGGAAAASRVRRSSRTPPACRSACSAFAARLLLLLQLQRSRWPVSPRRACEPRCALRFQRGDLGLVAPAEHVAGAIVDAVAVVLLVALAAAP